MKPDEIKTVFVLIHSLRDHIYTHLGHIVDTFVLSKLSFK